MGLEIGMRRRAITILHCLMASVKTQGGHNLKWSHQELLGIRRAYGVNHKRKRNIEGNEY